MRRDKISAVDTAWLRMDRPHNLMMISGVLMFDEPRRARAPAAGRSRSACSCSAAFASAPSSCPGSASGRPTRTSTSTVMSCRPRLPGKAGKRELQALVSRLIATPLDPARPMWQFHLVEKYDGGSALIVRIHHCYADGIALVRVMLSMTDASPDGPPAMPFDPPRRASADAGDSPLAALVQPVAGVMRTAQSIGATLLERGAGLWHDPAKALALAGQGGALGARSREAGADGAGLADALQGRARRGKARRVGRSAAARRSEGRRQGACCVGQRRAAVVRRRRAARLPRRQGRCRRRRHDPRARPGQPAAAGARRTSSATSSGSCSSTFRSASRTRSSALYAVRSNMNALKGSYQPIARDGPARSDGRRAPPRCRRRCSACSRATRQR